MPASRRRSTSRTAAAKINAPPISRTPVRHSSSATMTIDTATTARTSR
ncbi:hypothetical protein AAII07_09445 [Microvirga sp. 0TCS3.31]